MLPSSTVENYLKAIYQRQAGLDAEQLVPMGQLAAMLGVIVLGEHFTWHAIVGGVCILLSVGLIMSGRSARPQGVEG